MEDRGVSNTDMTALFSCIPGSEITLPLRLPSPQNAAKPVRLRVTKVYKRKDSKVIALVELATNPIREFLLKVVRDSPQGLSEIPMEVALCESVSKCIEQRNARVSAPT